ncbi:SDR family oxidoreductase [Antarcticibacterium sp. 1MA-6-2]|uniref:SDR family oxidoreductase n=1 Tax=Antarcticibacterium sp. 1MA-6-2 TaxID=2908210 RepID=UPI0021031923|nr:SDR family NAD(P)-dependent oxidoreductase [Antarcticibacterium sp. 1MA-6-2]
MDLQLKHKLFLICGASSGFGRAIAESLLQEGAHVFAVARREEKLKALQQEFPEQVEIFVGDLTKDAVISELEKRLEKKQLHGMLLNA